MEFFGLAAVICVAWDTQMSPGDVRSLRASQIATAGQGQLFFTERGKTGVPAGGVLSARSMRLPEAYLEKLGIELTRDAYIFRNRSGQPYSKHTLGDDFRTVRAAEFGPLERRMLGHDFRSSGAVEAITGGAAPAAWRMRWATLSKLQTSSLRPMSRSTWRRFDQCSRPGRRGGGRCAEPNEAGAKVGTRRPGKLERRRQCQLSL